MSEYKKKADALNKQIEAADARLNSVIKELEYLSRAAQSARKRLKAIYADEPAIFIDSIKQPLSPAQSAVAVVSAAYNVSPNDIMSERRSQIYVVPRHIAMWMLCQTDMSLPKIGRSFNRDHTTIMHARNSVEEKRYECQSFTDRTDMLLSLFRSREAARIQRNKGAA